LGKIQDIMFIYASPRYLMFAHAQAESFEKAKWIIVGIPSELGSLSKVKNYLEGPEAIRDASYRIFDPIFGKVNYEEIFDYGDLELEDIKNLEELYERIYQEIKKIYRKDKKYVFLGGDHSITYPILKLMKENHDFALLYFDAHPDCEPDPYVNYQSFMYYLIKERIIEPENVIFIGISNWSFREKEFLEENKILYFTPYEIWDNINNVIEKIREKIKEKKVYISIDLDVFDTGCGHWLEPFGIRPFHYFKIIKEIKDFVDLIAFDVVELYPQEFCENFAAKLIIETIALFNK